MSLSIGHFLNGLPVGPYPSLLDYSVSRNKILLIYLDSFRLSLSRVALSFQWIPGHAGLPGNERADSFAQTGATLPVTPSPWLQLLQRLDTLANLCGDELFMETHPSLSGAPFSAQVLPFLNSGANLGAWPDCWVSVEFLHAPIPRKGSDSTTTTKSSLYCLLFELP